MFSWNEALYKIYCINILLLEQEHVLWLVLLICKSPGVIINFSPEILKLSSEFLSSGGTEIISCFAGSNPILPVYRGEVQCRNLGMAVESWDEQGIWRMYLLETDSLSLTVLLLIIRNQI